MLIRNLTIIALLALPLAMAGGVFAQEEDPVDEEEAAAEAITVPPIKVDASKASSEKKESKKKDKKKPDFKKIAEVIEDAKKLEGFLTLYRHKDALYAEIPSSRFGKPFILNVSIAKGVAQGMVVSGMTVSESPLYWKLAEKKLFLVEKNVRHMASKKKEPIASAVAEGFGDSVIAVLKIQAKTGNKYLVDLRDFLFTDYANIGRQLSRSMIGSYRIDKNRTLWGTVKTFPKNVTVEVEATFAGGGNVDARTVADARSLPVTIHYSISEIPKTGYKPRLADPRMGYFITAVKDYSKKGPEEPFVRYINRWNLQKADPKADRSPPKKPIVFYIEKSVPYEYRPIVREGILEWNKAFERAGFINAIEVRYQEEDASWDAEDVRYNTIRWMTGESTFAIGPSRVNPETGEIYDADILVASSWLQYFDQQYRTFIDPEVDSSLLAFMDLGKEPETIEEFVRRLRRKQPKVELGGDWRSFYRCDFAKGFSQQLALAAMADAMEEDETPEKEGETPEKESKPPKKKGVPRSYIRQALKELIMHEVGHTLGLRHNFKASSALSMDQLHDKELVEERGLVGSVMDYSLVNLAPEGVEQGYYFTPTLGSWDYLAIEYGYKDVPGTGEGEMKALKKIASRAALPENAYATDGDVARDIDPLANRRDMSSDPLAFAKERSRIVSKLWDGLVDRTVDEGESYQKARTAFLYTLADKQQSLYFASRYVGGIYFNRNHKGDPNERPVFDVVSYEKQKEALTFVCEEALSDGSFDFDPEMLAQLAPNRWDHWGSRTPFRIDISIHDTILRGQLILLSRLFSGGVMWRLTDTGLYSSGDDVMTIAEVYGAATSSIWSELKKDLQAEKWTNRNPFVSSYRRNLQRAFLKYFLFEDALNTWPGLPQDVRSVAWYTLTTLKEDLDELVGNIDGVELDALSEAHLRETHLRIEKVLEASVAVRSF